MLRMDISTLRLPELRNLLATARRFLERYRMVPDGRAAERTVQAVRDLIATR